MCKCQETAGFKQQMSTAKRKETETGEAHAVFVLTNPITQEKHVFECKESDLNDAMGICCYFTTDEVEHVYTPIEVIVKKKTLKVD